MIISLDFVEIDRIRLTVMNTLPPPYGEVWFFVTHHYSAVYYMHSFCRMSFLSSSKKNQPEAYQSYVDTSGELSSKELGYGLWWVTHKAALYNAAVFFLGLIAASSWGFALYRGIQYGWYALEKEPRIIAEMARGVNYTALNQRFSPAALQVTDSMVLQGGSRTSDLVAQIVNPNAWFRAEFDYVFETGSGSTPAEHAVLLPGEERPVAVLGYDGDVNSGANVIIKNLKWRRISNRQIMNVSEYQNNRLLFNVQDFTFVRAESMPGVTAHAIRFSLTNASPFSYKNASFYVGLYVAETLVGIIPLEVRDFRSLETRAIDLRSFVQNLNVTDVRVFPLINVYDSEVYIKPGE